MPRYWWPLGLVIAVQFVAGFWPDLATAQTKQKPVEIRTLGLPLPDGVTKMAPAFGGSQLFDQTVASVHWDPTSGASSYTRMLRDPVVSKDNIGFYNASEQSLMFEVEIASERRTLTLGAREVLTLPVSGNSAVKGTISSGAVDTTTPLTPGAIYTIRAEANKWVFARF
jgi:hypothetical protein